MKKLIIVLLMAPTAVFSQCVMGDCENGVGTYIFEDGTIADGEWEDGELNGVGCEIIYNEEGEFQGMYDGEFKNDTYHGWGTETLYDDDGDLLGTYVGNFVDNDYNGWGIWIWRDGTIEKGIYKDGELE
jgi:hypothetical protein